MGSGCEFVLTLFAQAFARVQMMLETRSGLSQIISCMGGNVPLHGISDENEGIRECRCLFLEFQKHKHGNKKETPSATSAEVPDGTMAVAADEEWWEQLNMFLRQIVVGTVEHVFETD